MTVSSMKFFKLDYDRLLVLGLYFCTYIELYQKTNYDGGLMMYTSLKFHWIFIRSLPLNTALRIKKFYHK